MARQPLPSSKTEARPGLLPSSRGSPAPTASTLVCSSLCLLLGCSLKQTESQPAQAAPCLFLSQTEHHLALEVPRPLEGTVSQASGKSRHQLITLKPQAPVDGRCLASGHPLKAGEVGSGRRVSAGQEKETAHWSDYRARVCDTGSRSGRGLPLALL